MRTITGGKRYDTDTDQQDDWTLDDGAGGPVWVKAVDLARTGDSYDNGYRDTMSMLGMFEPCHWYAAALKDPDVPQEYKDGMKAAKRVRDSIHVIRCEEAGRGAEDEVQGSSERKE